MLRSLVCGVLAVGVLSAASPAFALANVSNWAVHEVTAAAQAGLEPDALASLPAAAPISREEFCGIALRLYEKMNGNLKDPEMDNPFEDTRSTAVAQANALGLVSGRGNGIFDPKGAITRQELCKMLDNVLASAGKNVSVADPGVLTPFPDRGELASWASDAVKRMLEADILRGVTDTQSGKTLLSPEGTTTREQALMLGLRFTETYAAAPAKTDTDPTPPAVAALSSADPEGAAPPAKTAADKTPAPEDTGAAEPDPAQTADDPDTSHSLPDNLGAFPDEPAAALPPLLHTSVPSPLPSSEEEKMAYVFGEGGSFFATPELAQAAMTEIEVPVWRITGGAKTSGKAYVTVNASLAPIYRAVFQEIYNGSERFPILDLGSYAWRSTPTSEHRWGTAIDLNADANMEATLAEDGTLTPTAGTHWTPGEDPYSIPEDGDVVRAFKKYGFSWGGDAWTRKRDYMHFSYFGR